MLNVFDIISCLRLCCRFTKALECFTNAQLMIQRHITPGKLTWPTTKTTVEETQPDCLQVRNLCEIMTSDSRIFWL